LNFHAIHDQHSYHTKSIKGNSMKVKTILHNLIEDVTPNMHKVRRKSLNAMVTSLISGDHAKQRNNPLNNHTFYIIHFILYGYLLNQKFN
jgi:hypothetical protein